MTRAPRNRQTHAHQTNWWIRLQAVLWALVLIVGCSGAPPTKPSPTATTSAPPLVHGTGLTYPRTAAVFLDQDALPPVEELARYDLLVFDNEWAHRMPRSFFDDLRRLNPRLKLLAYVNVVDSMKQSGTFDYWQNAYHLWRIDPSNPAANTFPDEWLARTASGTPVHEWQDRVMTNLTDQAPRVDGQLFVEYAVDWIVNTVWSAGIWDGIFLDVWGERIYTADSDHWDINRDGVDETDDQIYGADNPLDRGLTIGEHRLRAALPDAILVVNSDRTMRDKLLNGRAFESFMDPAAGRDVDTDFRAYLAAAASQDIRVPRVTMTINKNLIEPETPDFFRKSRFELGATLLQDGFWAPAGPDYGSLAYFDEMDGGGLGRGYLGYPLEPDPNWKMLSKRHTGGTGSPAQGVFRRDFEHGIVMVNTSAVPVTVPLERPFTKLKGKQDPVANDGSRVDSVNVGPQDAVILMR
jgi:Hypothetical glycosyl hydrolase family 15